MQWSTTRTFGPTSYRKTWHIVKLSVPRKYKCLKVQSPVPPTNEFISEFPEVFSGLGKIKGEPIQIAIKDGATPYHISAPRRVPIPMLQPLKAELERMEKLAE